MSHFTVLVIGPDVEGQLAPFNENLETKEYITGQVSEAEKMDFLEYYKNQEAEENTKKGQSVTKVSAHIDEFPAYYQKYGKSWNGNQWRVDDKGVWQHYSTYNPDSKWDWWQLGGRWGGMLLLKPDADAEPVLDFHYSLKDEEKQQMLASRRTDQARKGDIDWEQMRVNAANDANESYDNFEEEAAKPITHEFQTSRLNWWSNDAYPNDRHPSSPQKDFASFEEMILHMWRCEAARRTGILGYLEPDRIPSREEHVKDSALLSTFAVLKDGEWYEQGEMGWFGMSSATDEDKKKFKEGFFERWIEPLDDDTLISIVDCHI